MNIKIQTSVGLWDMLKIYTKIWLLWEMFYYLWWCNAECWYQSGWEGTHTSQRTVQNICSKVSNLPMCVWSHKINTPSLSPSLSFSRSFSLSLPPSLTLLLSIFFSPSLSLSLPLPPSPQYLCNWWLYPWPNVGPQGRGWGNHLCGGNDGGQRSPRLQLCTFSHIHPPCECVHVHVCTCMYCSMSFAVCVHIIWINMCLHLSAMACACNVMYKQWCNDDVMFSPGGGLGWSVGGGTEGGGAWIQSREIPLCRQQ